MTTELAGLRAETGARLPSAGPIDIGGNDYLDLARDPRVLAAARAGLNEYGLSATAGRLSLGWQPPHVELETALTRFFGAGDACIQGSAFLCGASFFSGLRHRFDAAVVDEFAHTNLLMGLRASGYRLHTYRHCNLDDLHRTLEAAGDRAVVVTDGVYGISGRLAPLSAIHRCARAAGAHLFVDDSHGIFALGDQGRGALDLFGLSVDDGATPVAVPGLPSNSPPAQPGGVTLMGSMSKALGCYGGFIAGSAATIAAVRSGLYYGGNTPLPPAIAAAAVTALQLVEQEPVRRQRLLENARHLRAACQGAGFRVVSDPATAIVTVDCDTQAAAEMLAARLWNANLRAKYFRYPTDPRPSLMRLIARTGYTATDLARIAAVLAAR